MKKIVAIAVMLLCLTGCGAKDNQLLQDYDNAASASFSQNDLLNELRSRGYKDYTDRSCLQYIPDSMSLSNPLPEKLDHDCNIGMSDFGKKLSDLFQRRALPHVEYNVDCEANDIIVFCSTNQKLSREDIEELAKTLQKNGLKNFYESFGDGNKGPIAVIQDGVLVVFDGSLNQISVNLQNVMLYGYSAEAWGAYVKSNLKDGFWLGEATTGGLMDRLYLQSGVNEYGNKYEKIIQIYKKEGKLSQIIFRFSRGNFSNSKTFIDKETLTVRNILKSFGASDQEVETFLKSYDPIENGEATIAGKQFSTKKENGKYVLIIK